jgi:lipoate-protein ligase B
MAKLATLALPLPAVESAIPMQVKALGRVEYESALAYQHQVHAERITDAGIDTLLLLEHPHVYTLGRNSDPSNILASDEFLRERGATVARNERGGEVTYHGPGQLVAYPIIQLRSHERSITLLVQRMEEAIVCTLRDYGIVGSPVPGDHGVWVDRRKIASIGMAVRRWVVLHGMALNVDPDLKYFSYINPCGHPGMPITSMARELGTVVDQVAVGSAFARNFARVFGRAEPST